MAPKKRTGAACQGGRPGRVSVRRRRGTAKKRRHSQLDGGHPKILECAGTCLGRYDDYKPIFTLSGPYGFTFTLKKHLFKNILNGLYSRDISKKVLAGWISLSWQGEFLGGIPPYGLQRDPAGGSVRCLSLLMKRIGYRENFEKSCNIKAIMSYVNPIKRQFDLLHITVNLFPRDQREIVEAYHESIASREQWDRVQKTYGV